MQWVAIIRLCMQAVAALAKFLGDRQLITAGQAEAVAKGQADAIELFDRAGKAADAMDRPATPEQSAWRDRVHDQFGSGDRPQH